MEALDARLIPGPNKKKYRSLLRILALGIAMTSLPLIVSVRVGGQPAPTVQFIGMASMSDDGTVTLRLISTSDGTPAHAVITYKAGDPRYDEVLRHIGGLKPGQTKPVPPWE